MSVSDQVAIIVHRKLMIHERTKYLSVSKLKQIIKGYKLALDYVLGIF